MFNLNYAFPKNWSGFKTPFSFSIRLLAAHGLLLLFCLLLLNATSLVQTHLEKSRCSISICAFSVPTTACPAYSPCGKQITVQQLNKLTRFSPSIDPKFAHVRTCLSWCSYAAWSRGAVWGMVIPLKIGFNGAYIHTSTTSLLTAPIEISNWNIHALAHVWCHCAI